MVFRGIFSDPAASETETETGFKTSEYDPSPVKLWKCISLGMCVYCVELYECHLSLHDAFTSGTMENVHSIQRCFVHLAAVVWGGVELSGQSLWIKKSDHLPNAFFGMLDWVSPQRQWCSRNHRPWCRKWSHQSLQINIFCINKISPLGHCTALASLSNLNQPCPYPGIHDLSVHQKI